MANESPYGYLNNLKTKTIEPHPVYSKNCGEGFEEYAKGIYTIEKLAKFLADLGMVTSNQTPLAKASIVRLLGKQSLSRFYQTSRRMAQWKL